MSRRTVREPTDEELAKLKSMKRQEVGRVSIRAHIVLLSSRGYSASQIAKIHDVTGPMVYKWFDRFDEEGPPGLYDRERNGRPKKSPTRSRKKSSVSWKGTQPKKEKTPRAGPQAGSPSTSTGNLMSMSIQKQFATRLIDWSTAGPVQGGSFPRPIQKPTGSGLAAIVEAVAKADEATSVLVEDETILKRFPPLRRMWQPVGEQRAVWVPEENDDFTLYGSLDLASGQTYVEAFEKGRSDCATQYLESLLEETAGKVLLIWDQATWHTSGQVTEWLENTGRVETYLLPVRSPEANPMEDLWRELKEQVAACLERSLEALLESCQQYFDDLSGKNTLRTAGIY